MAILALDVGSKRIGVAVADPTGSFAIPVDVIQRDTLNRDLERIAEFVESYLATELVVGDPVTLSGERSIASEKMDAFVESLRRVFTGPIHMVDERMTTAQVTKTLIGADMRRSKRKTVVDKMAAALILESFLQRRRNQRP